MSKKKRLSHHEVEHKASGRVEFEQQGQEEQTSENEVEIQQNTVVVEENAGTVTTVPVESMPTEVVITPTEVVVTQQPTAEASSVEAQPKTDEVVVTQQPETEKSEKTKKKYIYKGNTRGPKSDSPSGMILDMLEKEGPLSDEEIIKRFAGKMTGGKKINPSFLKRHFDFWQRRGLLERNGAGHQYITEKRRQQHAPLRTESEKTQEEEVVETKEDKEKVMA